VIYESFEVVVVPFPFTDSRQSKRRPALVLSSRSAFNARIGHSLLAMITSAENSPWPLDVAITDLAKAGLPVSSVVRMKMFTLDHRFVLGRLGCLSSKDSGRVKTAVRRLLGFVAE